MHSFAARQIVERCKSTFDRYRPERANNSQRFINYIFVANTIQTKVPDKC